MKHFLIINTSFFGDILLTGPLCHNIKLFFPDSHITFIANAPFIDAARYLNGVDNAIAYDKNNKHHGLYGAYKFYQEYKNLFKQGFDAAFVIYGNERGIILSYLFNAKKIYAENNGLIKFLLDNKTAHLQSKPMSERNTLLLEQYAQQKTKNLPMHYSLPKSILQSSRSILNKYLQPQDNFICLCTTSKKIEKDMPISTAKKLLDLFADTSYKIILLGAGESAVEYSAKLADKSSKFIDLTNQTSIAELGGVLSLSHGLISVDTGTMHLGLAVQIPVTALFYIAEPAHINKWGPDPSLYKSSLLTANECNADNIYQTMVNLLHK